MSQEEELKQLIVGDERLMKILHTAQELHLPDWFVAAGAIRNSVWDTLEELEKHTSLNDVDLVFYDSEVLDEEREKVAEKHLSHLASEFKWEVVNQARIVTEAKETVPNTCEGIARWPETPTCIGVRLESTGELTICAPYGLEDLLGRTVRVNPKYPRPEVYEQRKHKKRWDEIWPGVRYLD